MTKITIKDLLDAGIHFGHRKNRWNPKMSEYIFGHRNGIHIIDNTYVPITSVSNRLARIAEMADKFNARRNTIVSSNVIGNAVHITTPRIVS